jgi:hypothetical protein
MYRAAYPPSPTVRDYKIQVSAFETNELLMGPGYGRSRARSNFKILKCRSDRLRGLVVRAPGYTSRSSGFNSRRLERGPPSLVSTVEALLGRRNRGSVLENREYGRGDPSRQPPVTLYQQTLALTSPTSGGRSIGIVRSLTEAKEFVFITPFQYFLHGHGWVYGKQKDG